VHAGSVFLYITILTSTHRYKKRYEKADPAGLRDEVLLNKIRLIGQIDALC